MPAIAILGGGPAGATAALVLARAGFEVTLVDASEGPRAKIGEALPPSARPLLARLELLELLEAPDSGHRPNHGNRSLWGSEHLGEEDFLFGVHGSGWHLDRARFEAGLAAAAIEAGAAWRWDHHAVDAQMSGGRWQLEVEGPEALVNLELDFILDATGRPARFARGAGGRRVHLDRLVGVAVRLESALAPALESFTFVEAVEGGWWYSAPLCEGQVIAAYMSDGDLFDTRAARTEAGWRALLADAPHTHARLRPWLEHSASPIEPTIAPAGSAYTSPPFGPGWLAIGDAALAFDPLSSHGIGSAMTTGYYGACAVAEALGGQPEALAAYADLAASMFDDYLELLHTHYVREQRFSDAPFWQRRHARLARLP